MSPQTGKVVSWSRYDKDGVLEHFPSLEDYLIDCLKNLLENADEDKDD